MNLFSLIRHELRLSFRQGADAFMAVIFFCLVAILFPFAIGPESQTLRTVTPAVVWISVLLASLLSLDRLFQPDFEDGTLDLWILGPLPLEWIALGKIISHWILTAVPIVLAAPAIVLTYSFSFSTLPLLLFSLLLGSISLSSMGILGASLTLGAHRSSILLGLLLLPLYIPILIFGTLAMNATLMEMSARPHLLLLGSIALVSHALCPLATAFSLRHAATS